MPLRLLNGPVSEITAAALSAIMLAAGSVIDGLSNGQTIYDKEQFRMYCIIGALGGAFLSVAIFPPRESEGNYARRLAIKFFSSGVAGMLFTPVIMQWREWPVNVDSVLAVSGAVALVAVTMIHSLVPLFVRKVMGKIDVTFPSETKNNSDNPPTDTKP